MIPLKITLSGFMSYREKQTLNFDGARLWVLSGPNGAGKSAIFDAITFVLFGVYRDQRQNFTDLINHNCDRAEVIYDFRLGDIVYRVQRTISKRGAATRCAYTLIPVPDGGDPKLEPIERTDLENGFKAWLEHTIGLNYETFTASVLLQQGKSDRLLDSATDQRYKILSKLIDLSRYEELGTRAKDRQRYWHSRVSYYDGQLANLPPVLDKEIVAAEQRVKQANEASISASKKVSELTDLYGRAQKWETLYEQLETEQVELSKARQLIDQETDIVQNYQRWVELCRVLPVLKGLLASRARLDDAQKSEIQHRQEQESALELLRLAEEQEERLEHEYQEKNRIASAYQQEVVDASNRQIELSPVIVLLDRIDANLLKQKEYQKDLGEFPPDLSQQFTNAVECEVRFSEAGRAVSWLRNLFENRKKLGDTIESRDKAIKSLEQTQISLEEARLTKQKRDSEYDQARQMEAKTNSSLAKAQARLEEILDKARRFHEVEGEKVCRYCGNEMTSEHVEREKGIIQAELDQAKDNVGAAQDEHDAAVRLADDTESASKTAGETVRRCEDLIQSYQRDIETAIQDINGYLLSLSTAYSNLPQRFQNSVAESLPRDEAGWLATTYPELNDISQIKKEGDDEHSQHIIVEQLREIIAKHDNKLALLAEVEKSLEQDQIQLPGDWETARSEYEAVRLQRKQADGNLKTALSEQTRIEHELSLAKQEAGRLRKKNTDTEAALNKDHAMQVEILNTLRSYEEQLTLEWQPIAASLTSNSLNGLQTQRDNLSRYDQLYRDLDVAKQNVGVREKKIAELEEKVSNIPESARSKAETIRLELTRSQEESQQADKEIHKSEQDYQMLIKRKSDREIVEAKKLNAERKTHLYSILVEQMGDQGIQQDLINQAEVEIVNEANQSLYNLSGGRWTLTLRERGRNKKALDMEVRDTMTGGQGAIPVVLASGSQRFRIAISLALAIGKYIRRESRRIESVIIDEGFGSLDKTGREDTIQELHSLQQHLERIVLVSHQEEFYKTFQTGYTIDIVNGSSQASLLNN